MSRTQSESQSERESEFDWLQLRDEIHIQDSVESTRDKFLRKVKENPLVPIGIYQHNLTFN
jgi:hypothetical protein